MPKDQSRESYVMDKQLLKEIIEFGSNVDKGYFEIAHIVACYLPKHLHEQLKQLVNGPIWDGDVISKANRGALFDLGLAIRVCCKGEQGYTGATCFAYTIIKIIKQIESGEIGA